MNIAQWKQLLEHITCCSIGEESYFRRHIQKQALNNNKQALTLLQAQEAYQALLSEIQHSLQIFQSFGHDIIKSVCDVIIGLDDFNLKTAQLWTICSISGGMCYECIQLDLKTSPQMTVNIDSRYKELLECIWILFHVEKIQISRIMDFEKTLSYDEKHTISDKISLFLQSKNNETKRLAQTLVLCVNYVKQSLDDSLEILKQNKSGCAL